MVAKNKKYAANEGSCVWLMQLFYKVHLSSRFPWHATQHFSIVFVVLHLSDMEVNLEVNILHKHMMGL